MSEPKKKKDEDEITMARSIFDEIVEETEKPDFKFPIEMNRSLDQKESQKESDEEK